MRLEETNGQMQDVYTV